MKKSVIELIRVSTEAQAAEDRASIPAQKAVNRRTCQTYGLEIVRSIEISDVSGAAVLLAPEVQELTRLMASPDIHGVVAREFSRLMRPENFSDYAFLQAFADTGTLLYLPEGPLDFGSKMGRFMGTLRAAFAGMERTEILERVWTAKEEKRRAGKFGQSAVCLPFGVGYDENRGWYYKPEAERVREAFRLFLSGDNSYFSVGRRVGIEPYNLRIILRNPIYMGWRVIDKRRDPSPSARRAKADGRQGDRPKIKRAPEDIITINVIGEPLISEADFKRVQQIMDLKRLRHWRAKPDRIHRFTYNGFMTCSECGELLYTKFQRDDYYVCKKRILEKQCPTRYMRRDILDPELDKLFSKRLTDYGFLREIAEEVENSSRRRTSLQRVARLQSELTGLQSKRQRILDSFFDGVISSSERDARLLKVDRDLARTQGVLLSEKPEAPLSADLLASVFAPFYEYQLLSRRDKRRLLSTIVPDIKVSDYRIEGLYFLPDCSGEVNHTGRGSSQRQA